MPLRTGDQTPMIGDYALVDQRLDAPHFAGDAAQKGAFLLGVIARVQAPDRPIESAARAA
jgi:hypothetical protein